MRTLGTPPSCLAPALAGNAMDVVARPVVIIRAVPKCLIIMGSISSSSHYDLTGTNSAASIDYNGLNNKTWR